MASHGLEPSLKDRVPLVRHSDLLLVLNTPKGRGVVAARNIPAQTVLDVCPVLVLSPEEFEQHVKHTRIYFYTYNWPNPPPTPPRPTTPIPAIARIQASHPPLSQPPPPTLPQTQTQALPLGLGSLFNHSSLRQNVGWTRDTVRQLIVYRTLRAIKEGEELCISYGESTRLGFVDVEEEERKREEAGRLKREEREFLMLGGEHGAEGGSGSGSGGGSGGEGGDGKKEWWKVGWADWDEDEEDKKGGWK